MARTLGPRLRWHAPLLAVLALGLLLRVLTELAFRPALLFYDSVTFLAQANGGLFSNPDEPAGYPIAIRILRVGTHSLAVLTTAQHLAGLLTGVLVYLVTVRLTGRRWLAAAGCGVIVLDGYSLAVEQYVMADAFFSLMVMASVALLVVGRRRRIVLIAGLLLAAACMVRSVGLFCVPVWLLFVLWRYRWSATALLAAAVVLVPVAGYATLNQTDTGHFGLTDDTAWLIYGRVAPFGNCHGLSLPAADRILCPAGSQRNRTVNYYLNAPGSPAVRAFGKPSTHAPGRVNHVLLDYAEHVMAARPLNYLGAVGQSLADFFTPAAHSEGLGVDGALKLPQPGPWLWPTYRPAQHWPASLLRSYTSVVHTCRPLLAFFLVLALLGLVLEPPWSEGRTTALRASVALLAGTGVALMLGSALAHFELRYTLPAIAPLTAGGLIAAPGVFELLRQRRTRQKRRVGNPV